VGKVNLMRASASVSAVGHYFMTICFAFDKLAYETLTNANVLRLPRGRRVNG
jgi:hypothetical protein